MLQKSNKKLHNKLSFISIKAPTMLTHLHLQKIISAFQTSNYQKVVGKNFGIHDSAVTFQQHLWLRTSRTFILSHLPVWSYSSAPASCVTFGQTSWAASFITVLMFIAETGSLSYLENMQGLKAQQIWRPGSVSKNESCSGPKAADLGFGWVCRLSHYVFMVSLNCQYQYHYRRDLGFLVCSFVSYVFL